MRPFIVLLFVLASLFPAINTFAIDLNPQQVQALQRLSPAEKADLAKKAGVAGSASGQIKDGKTIESPEVMTPRTPEKSSLEGTVAGTEKGEPEKGEPEKGEPEKGEPEKGEPEKGKLNKAFGAFVDESKRLTVETDLAQFGYDLFAGTPTTFAPATDVPVPSEYVLGPGDELKIQLFGKLDDQLIMVVDREGMIAFPQIGPLSVAGMSFSDAKAFIAEQIKEKTIGVSASITMGELRSIRVFALGEVERPGSYTVSGLSTLSHALFVSGGVKKIGSLRNIQLKRNGKKIATIDLYDFLLKGDTSADVRLLPGDVVFVPPIGQTVSVAGEVIRPAIYELKGEKSLKEVLSLAGSIRPTAYRDKALIERVKNGDKRVVLELKLKGEDLETSIKDHDLIKVFSITEFEENPIFLIGNVKRPGKFAWQEGMRLSHLLKSPDDLLPESYLEYGLIEREAEGNKEPELFRFQLKELFSPGGKGSARDPLLKKRDKVYVFHRQHFMEKPKVSIVGSVQKPGDYELKKSMRIVDLILASGGVNRDAFLEGAELYQTDTETKEHRLININLKKALSGDENHNIHLFDLDRLVVHSIWETRQRSTVSIRGEVHNPSDYPLVEYMRVSDLVFAAGNVTEKAFLKSAEITRYGIFEGEKRVSEHFQISLQDALDNKGESNVLLKPYDVINIRTVSNWRPAATVKLEGELRYPGDYPIEEGEKLSSVLERAGGFLQGAYLPAAVFTRVSIREEQQKQLEEIAKKIEGEITRIELNIGGIHDPQLLSRKKNDLDESKRILDQFREVKSTGRLVVQLCDLELLKGSHFDVTLRDGDLLYVPKQPDEVHVLGQVYSNTALLFNPNLDREDYIKRAGGVTRFGDESKTYVVRASGEVDPQTGWGTKKIFPGDVVVVPEKLERFNLLDSSLDWSRVLMQLGVSIASMKTLNLL